VNQEPRVSELLEAYAPLRDPERDPQLEAVMLAVFLEDALEIVIPEDDITLAVLLDPVAVEGIATRRKDIG